MSKRMAIAVANQLPVTPAQKFWVRFKKNWQLHLMVLAPLLYLLLFSYGPLYGLQIAFKTYSPKMGIPDSPWVGIKNWTDFFGYRKWTRLVWNTVAISLYQLLVFPLPIVLALTIHINTHKGLAKIAQNISYIPHFISLVVMIGILFSVLNPVSGFLGYIYRVMGKVDYDDIRGSNDAFRHLYVWSGVWKGVGWSSIIYLSALSGVPEELHEAAKLDGASRLRRVWSIDIPTIMPTIVLLLIMEVGGIMSVGYQKAYLMQNTQNAEVSELISTYVYTKGIQSGNNSFGSAVGLLNSLINTGLVFLANAVANALTDGEMGLF
ncbi:MAG: sugar ABC transporter permease [Oscillospiraceae bacterium]|nr:sugar ABC transporter permease [Oscillospiraceae bacterium]